MSMGHVLAQLVDLPGARPLHTGVEINVFTDADLETVQSPSTHISGIHCFKDKGTAAGFPMLALDVR